MSDDDEEQPDTIWINERKVGNFVIAGHWRRAVTAEQRRKRLIKQAKAEQRNMLP